MLNTGGPSIKYNKIHVLRTKIRVLFVLKSLKDETPLVFSILGCRATTVEGSLQLNGEPGDYQVCRHPPPSEQITATVTKAAS